MTEQDAIDLEVRTIQRCAKVADDRAEWLENNSHERPCVVESAVEARKIAAAIRMRRILTAEDKGFK